MGIQWRKGQKELPPNVDPLVARAFSDPLSVPGPWLTWLKARLELETPDFHKSSIYTSCCEELLTIIETQSVIGPGGHLIPPEFQDYVSFGGGCSDVSGPINVPNGSYSVGLGALAIGNYRANVEAGYRLVISWGMAGSRISGIRFNITGDDALGSDVAQVTTAGSLGYYEEWPGPYAGGFNWDGSSWTGPAMTVDETAGGSYSAAELGESYTVSAQAKNSSGFSDGTLDSLQFCCSWVWLGDVVEGPLAAPVPYGGDDVVALQWDPTAGEWESVSALDLTARVGVRVNSGGTPSVRRQINFVEGNGIDLSQADDSGNEEVDVTLTVDETELDLLSLDGYPGGTGSFLQADGTFAVVATDDRLVAQFSGTPVVGGTYPAIIPRGNGDADITIDLERFALRLEVPASSGDTIAKLQKATGGGAPAWSDVATCTISATSYEATEQTIGAHTVTSGDLLRLYFTSVGTDADYYTGTATGTEV